MFQLVAAGRAGDGYRQSDSESWSWVAGGRFERPGEARGIAWRVYRDVEADARPV